MQSNNFYRQNNNFIGKISCVNIHLAMKVDLSQELKNSSMFEDDELGFVWD